MIFRGELKMNIIQIMIRTIKNYNNIICQCELDIEQGKDVDGNKAKIFEIQDAIWDIQRRVEFKLGYI